jgi:hypothetical protein
MDTKSKIMLSKLVLCITCMSLFLFTEIFAQKIDSLKISVRPKIKNTSRFPQIKSSTSNRIGSVGYGSTLYANAVKTGKILTVSKVYPNPVESQVNINLKLDRETNLSIKITDVLGNDVITLINERTSAGEHTKTFNIPDKLNTGIYFLRIVAGGEPIIKRISVL